MRATDFKDSSGIGMHINLKWAAVKLTIQLFRCALDVSRMLMLSGFDSHFDIA